MEFKLTVGFSAEAQAVLETLASALSGQVTAVAATEEKAAPKKEVAKKEVAKKEVAKKEEAAKSEDGPVYWFNSTDGSRGVAESTEEFLALKAEDSKVVKHTKEMYEAGVKTDAEKATKAAAAKKTKAAAAKKTKAADEVTHPSEEDVIAAFSQFLPADLTDEEKAERRPIVKAILDRFDAKRATLLAEDQRALAINLVQRAAAGQEIDPANDEFQEIEDDEDLF